jgi:hypothetical protein
MPSDVSDLRQQFLDCCGVSDVAWHDDLRVPNPKLQRGQRLENTIGRMDIDWLTNLQGVAVPSPRKCVRRSKKHRQKAVGFMTFTAGQERVSGLTSRLAPQIGCGRSGRERSVELAEDINDHPSMYVAHR